MRPATHPDLATRAHAPSALAQASVGAALIVASLGGAALVSLEPRAAREAVAIYPFWWSGRDAIAAAVGAGEIKGVGRFQFIVATASAEPGLVARLRKSGAWIVVEGANILGCKG